MSLGDGTLGLWLNREDVVVNTDRHLSFSPAIDKCLPRVQHRYDVRHIIANMHDHGWKNVVGHMFNCHKAIDRGEFDTPMKTWRLEHTESAAYADELPLIAINNFISFYQKLLSSQKLVCDTIVAGGAKYTQYASMVCQNHFSDAKHYDVFFRDGGQRDTYEVTRRGQSARTRKTST
ncbi:hypothetical protein B484DRAFT_406925 [Ochromonadaceae sp. CCMP2298]|nr:hypothetical protein B484DRAFT_406925 [Ochromonadaceae sp. CCMP2298]